MSEHTGGNGSGSGEKHVDLIAAARNAAGSGSGSAGGGGPLMPGGESVDLGGLGERFEILERISGGGQGVVHRARQFSPSREVAIKLMQEGERANEQQRARFAREAEVVSRLSHPNIIRVYESGVVDGRCYFAMEYVDGMSIDDFAMLNGSTAEQLIGMLVKVCRAISHAHQKGIIHRDIKPGNILVTKDGEPHVLDFGLAREAEGSRIVNAARAASMSGQVIGTTAYLSPEQAKGKSREADTRTDVYGLGVTLYYLLAQQFPYDIEGSPEEVRERIIKMPALPLRSALKQAGTHARAMTPGLAADVEAVLGKALEKDPELRYRSAADMADELERCLKGEPVTARASNRVYRLRKWARRHRLGVTVGGLIAATIVAALVTVTLAWRQSERAVRAYHEGLSAWSVVRTAEGLPDKARRAAYEKAARMISVNETSEPALLRIAADIFVRLAMLDLTSQTLKTYGTSLAFPTVVQAETAAKKIPLDVPASITVHAKVAALQANLAQADKRPPIALSYIQQARALRDRAIRESDANQTQLAEMQMDLASDYRASASYLGALRFFDDAFVDACTALEMARRLASEHSDDPDALLLLASALNTMAAWHIRLQSDEEDGRALSYLDEEERLLRDKEAAGLFVARIGKVKRLRSDIRENKRIVVANARERQAEKIKGK